MTTRTETPAEYVMRKGMDPYEQIDLQAEEIERLRTALERIARESCYYDKHGAKACAEIAREALRDD